MELRLEQRPAGPALDGAPLSPLIARLYSARGVTSTETDYALKHLPRYDNEAMQQAVRIIAAALEEQQRILIVGDFDADGATSTSVLKLGLESLGAASVEYLVPNRFDFGYGLTPQLVEVALDSKPDLIITVDNGVSSIEGVAAAKAAGIKVIVTDHHLPGETLPNADAMVNPNVGPDIAPSKNLAGVGVAFYVLVALRAHLRDAGWFETRPAPNLGELLDLVALGTVADVVPLDFLNRILVAQGIKRMQANAARTGIKSLIQVAGRQPLKMTSTDLGFALGPRLNAAGRLEDMSIGIECLLSQTPALADKLAKELDSLNRSRKEIEFGMREEALAQVERVLKDKQGDVPWAMVVFHEDWHQGVVGLVAARVKERFYRPTIAFADAGGGEVKGSARSIPGIHMRDALALVDANNPGMIPKFGGHAMAAGLSLRYADLPRFTKAFEQAVLTLSKPEDFEAVLLTDGPLAMHEITVECARELRAAGPWGQRFPEPVFDNDFDVVQRSIVGEDHLRLTLKHPDGGAPIKAIYFRGAEHEQRCVGRKRFAYKLEVDDYGGFEKPQLIIEYVED